MNITTFKSDYQDLYVNADKKALSWIFKNRKLLAEKFGKKFPKSPYEFVVQFKTEKGTLLLDNNAEVKSLNNVAYLTCTSLKKLGCPSSF